MVLFQFFGAVCQPSEVKKYPNEGVFLTGPIPKSGFQNSRDSILSARLLYILSNLPAQSQQHQSSLTGKTLQFQLPLPVFLQAKKQGSGQYQYKFDPLMGNINLKLLIFSNPISSFTFGIDSRLYRPSRMISNTLITRLVKIESKQENEIYFRYQFHKFALISSWEFSSLRNKFDEGARWDEDKIKIVISYLF